RLHRLLSRSRQLLLAPGLLVRFVRPPLLQLGRPPVRRERDHARSPRSGVIFRAAVRAAARPRPFYARFSPKSRGRVRVLETASEKATSFLSSTRPTWLHLASA